MVKPLGASTLTKVYLQQAAKTEAESGKEGEIAQAEEAIAKAKA
jgi:hypothetical protein